MPASPANTKIGFVGLGIMGAPMAQNLLKAGFGLKVYNRSDRPRVQEVVDAGGERVATPRDAAEACDVVITMVTDTPDVEAVVLGEDGVIQGVSSGATVIDMSTISPRVTQDIAAKLKDKGVSMLDAPVSGGDVGAINATLSIMVGGDEVVFQRIKPTLDAIGSHVVYCGPIGSGAICKICNNLMSMGIGVLLAEALTLGVKAGVDLAVLADVIANSSGGSKRLTEKFPRFLFKGNFEPGFTTALAAKDVRLATDLGREYGIPMELSNLVDQRHVEALFREWGQEDSDSIARIQEEKSGVQLRMKGV